MDNSVDDSSQSCCSIADKNNNLSDDLTPTIKSPFRGDNNDLTNCDSNQHLQQSTNNPLSLISKCSQRAFKSSDPDSPWTCPSTNSPTTQQQSNRHCTHQCLRKRGGAGGTVDKSDLINDETNNCVDCEEESMLLDIPPEYARDDIELVVDLYIWFEKVRSFLLGLLC